MSEKAKSQARVSSNLPCGRQEKTWSKGKDLEGSEPLEKSSDLVDLKEKALPSVTMHWTMPAT